MDNKKLYIFRLAEFLVNNDMVMSGEELADHLNRNEFLTSYGTEYQGKRGIYRLISTTFDDVKQVFGEAEARRVAVAFVKPDGTYAY